MNKKVYKAALVVLLGITQNAMACSGVKSAQCWWSADNQALMSSTAIPNMCLNQQTQAKKCYDALTTDFDSKGVTYQAIKAKLKSNGVCGSNGTFHLIGEVGTNGKKFLRSSSGGNNINVTCP